MVKTFLDQLPLVPLIAMSLTLGLAPFFPEPHLVEKAKMLFGGSLTKPVDIFDLVLHATPWVLLILKLGVLMTQSSSDAQ